MITDTRSSRLRMSILAAVILSLFFALFARLWFLQVLSESEFVELAERNTTDTIIEPAPRGRILDVKGRVLVDNRPSIVITIDKEAVVARVPDAELDELFLRLAREISRSGQLIKVSDLRAAYGSNRYGPFADVPIAYDISEELQVYLAERAHEFPGVNTDVQLVRDYPYGELAAHLLGYVGPLNEEELAAVQSRETDKPYLANDEIGKSGIELFFEDALRGTPGVREVVVDSSRKIIDVLEDTPARPGSDVRLSIDIDIQGMAEAELKNGLDLARQQAVEWSVDGIIEYRAPAGAVVIVDPRDGAVRAMASYPTYDPALFVAGISEAAFSELNDDPAVPLLNRAIQGEYAPGSTFKPFTAYAAMDTGLLGSRGVRGVYSGFEDPGFFEIPGCEGPGCEVQNARRQRLGTVDLPLSLTWSSDVYYYDLASQFDQRAGFDRESVQVAARQFGFGAQTGVTLPAESPGRIPTAEFKEAAGDIWRTGDSLNTAIGQGDVLATPMQIASAYAVIANGGTLYSPNLADAVLDPITGEVEIDFGGRVMRELYWPEAFARPIDDGLAGVTVRPPDDQGRSGTGYTAFKDFPHDEWPVSGKTGTSEKKGVERVFADFALFAGYGPNPDPEYVGVVVLEEAGFGGAYAAPVLRVIFEAIATDTVPVAVAEGAEPVPVEGEGDPAADGEGAPVEEAAG